MDFQCVSISETLESLKEAIRLQVSMFWLLIFPRNSHSHNKSVGLSVNKFFAQNEEVCCEDVFRRNFISSQSSLEVERDRERQ